MFIRCFQIQEIGQAQLPYCRKEDFRTTLKKLKSKLDDLDKDYKQKVALAVSFIAAFIIILYILKNASGGRRGQKSSTNSFQRSLFCA